MALFDDDGVLTVRDLTEHETGIRTVAGAEEIELESKIRLATRRVGVKLHGFLFAQLRGSLYADAQDLDTVLSRVVVTEPLHLWLAVEAIASVYRDASSRKSIARYQDRLSHFERLSDETRDLLMQCGVGLVADPIHRAADPGISVIPGNVGPSAVVLAISWTKGSAEGAASLEKAASIAAGYSVQLIPPPSPSGIDGYHVYGGRHSGRLLRQTSTPVSTESPWTLPDIGVIDGPGLPFGQKPSFYVRDSRKLSRG